MSAAEHSLCLVLLLVVQGLPDSLASQSALLHPSSGLEEAFQVRLWQRDETEVSPVFPPSEPGRPDLEHSPQAGHLQAGSW